MSRGAYKSGSYDKDYPLEKLQPGFNQVRFVVQDEATHSKLADITKYYLEKANGVVTLADYPIESHKQGWGTMHKNESIDGNGYASFKSPSVDYAQSDRMTITVLLHLFLDNRSSVQNLNSTYKKELKIKVPSPPNWSPICSPARARIASSRSIFTPSRFRAFSTFRSITSTPARFSFPTSRN